VIISNLTEFPPVQVSDRFLYVYLLYQMHPATQWDRGTFGQLSMRMVTAEYQPEQYQRRNQIITQTCRADDGQSVRKFTLNRRGGVLHGVAYSRYSQMYAAQRETARWDCVLGPMPRIEHVFFGYLCLKIISAPMEISPFVSRLSRQCGILNILQPYRPPRPVTGIALLTYLWRYRHL
jgi:hypothetical protein